MKIERDMTCPYCYRNQEHVVEVIGTSDTRGIACCDEERSVKENPSIGGCGRSFSYKLEIQTNIKTYKME